MKPLFHLILLGTLTYPASGAEVQKAIDCSNPKKNKVPCYIMEVRKVLKTYGTQIQAHIKRNEAAYQEIGERAAQGRRDAASGELRYERARRSERLAADFVEGRKPVSMWKDFLKEYGDVDWRMTRELLEKESIDGAEFLTGLASLSYEVAKVDALDTVLSGLEKPETFLDQIQLLQKFGSETVTEFDKKVCAGLKTELTAATQSAAALQKAVAALAEGGPARTAKEAELKAAQAGATALTKRRTSKKCTD